MRRAHPIVLSLLATAATWMAALPAVEAHAQVRAEPRLESVRWPSRGESVRARGIDPSGPRELVLWTWHQEIYSRLASTRSGSDGRFDFGQIPVPAEGLYLGVAEDGRRPRLDALIRVERPLPAPKIATTLGAPQRELIVYPARVEGELRLFDADSGRLVLRWPVDPRRGGTTTIDVAEALGARPTAALRLIQVLEDGRISAPTFYRFPEAPAID